MNLYFKSSSNESSAAVKIHASFATSSPNEMTILNTLKILRHMLDEIIFLQ